jgi:cytochrome c biogenesis protein CcmG, thiol:disulfide interchange protein DsbE
VSDTHCLRDRIPGVHSRRAFVGSFSALALLALPSGGRATVGGRPANFTLRSAQGAPWKGIFKLSDHLGKRPLFIHFFATWCNPCEIEMTTVEKLRPGLEAKGLVIVGVSTDDAQSAPGVGPLARRLKVNYPVVVDADSTVTARLNPRRVCPYSLFVDRRGIIVREREGWTPEHARNLGDELEALVSK